MADINAADLLCQLPCGKKGKGAIKCVEGIAVGQGMNEHEDCIKRRFII